MEIEGKTYYVAMVARTVIITDGCRAVLFTAWNEADIEREKEEHFPGQDNLLVLSCDHEEEIPGWPVHDFGDWQLRCHEVLCSEICALERIGDGA